ncbi:MAG: AAA family ATPase [Maribacter sp.]|nr:AAA family ATPase [Maribacter sp.]
MIIMVFGLPGSGKSFFAARLAKELLADHVNSDRVRKKMFSERTYSEVEKAAVYDAMLVAMERAIRENENLVLDATFYKNKTRQLFLDKAKEDIFIIEVLANETLIEERLKKSRPDSEADMEVYQLIKQQWEPLPLPHLVLESNNGNIDAMLQKAIQYLNYDPKTNR